MHKILITIFVLVNVLSCSAIRPLNSKKNSTIEQDSVGLELNEHDLNSTETSLNNNPINETIGLGDRDGEKYIEEGNNRDADISLKQSRLKLRVGLSFGPGLYRSISHITLLKSLERQSIKPYILTGTEFGAIIAAMYASGMTPESIEWSFYKYFKEKRSARLYTKKWIEDVDKILLEKLNGKKIEDLEKKFILTLYSPLTKKTYYFDKGNLRSLLLKNMTLYQSDSSDDDQKYFAAFEYESFNSRLLKRLGADFTIGIDVLGKKIEFKDSNEFLVGVYGKAIGMIKKDRKEFDYFYSLSVDDIALDSSDKSTALILRAQDAATKNTLSIKKLIKEKQASPLEI